MSSKNYSLNSDRPAFSALDDDDMTSAFMNSSSAPYLAENRLPQSREEKAIAEAEQRRENLLQQMKQVEQRTLDSSKRSIGMLIESEKVGIETAEDLSRQREQLTTTEGRLDEMNTTLKDTQKNINGIKSVFSSMRQWWNAPKNAPSSKDKEDAKSQPTSPTNDNPVHSSYLSGAVESSQSSLQSSQASHPGLRLRGVDDEEEVNNANFQVRSKQVNKQLDDDLDTMSSGLSRLKMLATGLGDEIGDQNKMVDRIHTKADKADLNIGSQNKQMNRILKK